MDPVKMKFALALCLSMVVAAAEPVFAQSSNPSAALSAKVDGVRERCGLGLLARTTSGQTCQSFKDYGSRMQCVANDLADEAQAKGAPILVEVARCYRALSDALVAGRGANNDQVNALEDICRNLRHETVVPRSTSSRDALLFGSDALMPSFSRRTVAVPTNDPMRGLRLHDLPECMVALSVSPRPTAVAVTPVSNRASAAGNGAVTSPVQSPRFTNLTSPGGDLAASQSPTSIQAVPESLAEGQTTVVNGRAASAPAAGSASALAFAPQPTASIDERSVADKVADGVVDRTVGKPKARTVVADNNASAPISESAVISALPAVSTSGRKPARRTNARAERSPAGYDVTAGTYRARSTPRTLAGANAGAESQSGARSSSSSGAGYGYSASSPPSLPLMGPPLRPQTAGSVR
jgi:hypothetical protein